METRIQTRWPDFDALGHLNHAVYHVYLDEARDAALRGTVGDFERVAERRRPRVDRLPP
jgi:acyl-CoA thioesterase FadM